MAENVINKKLYKLFLLVSKVLPMILAFCHLLNIVLSYFYIEDHILNYISGISILTILYLYLVSYIIKLCSYYRMFLHYCVIINIINVYDYYIGIPLNDKELFMLYLVLTIITMFIVLYLKLKKVL